MKTLHLLRHAKSSWKDSSLPDRDRPLAGRGRRAAKAIAKHMRAQGIEPDLVLCSPARRARETLERIEPALGRGAVEVDPALYGGTADALVERLRAVPETIGSVLVIGHNPGLQQLAVGLARPSDLRSELEGKYPTAALATLELASWRDLRDGGATLAGFVRPRDLA